MSANLRSTNQNEIPSVVKIATTARSTLSYSGEYEEYTNAITIEMLTYVKC